MDTNELRKAIDAKRDEKAAAAKMAAEEHEVKYLAAYLAALEKHDEKELVTVDVPLVGKVLLKFAHRADHARFTKEINTAVEVSPCLTFAVRCAVFPSPTEYKALLEDRNPEGFVTCALAVKKAMEGKVIEEGKE